jgi:hypothetical protein
MDGNHKLCRLRCLSNFPVHKRKTHLPKAPKLRSSARIANVIVQSKKVKNKYVKKKKSVKKNERQLCHADLVIKQDSGCDETPMLGSYFCKQHSSNINEIDNYDGRFFKFKVKKRGS